VCAQAADAIGRKRHSSGGGASLTIEDTGDDRIGIVSGQAAQELDGIFIGADCCRTRTRQRHVKFAQLTAAPAQRKVHGNALAIDRHDDFLKQRAQQPLAVPIGRGGRGPDCVEIFAKGNDRGAIFGRQCERLRVFATSEFGFGGLQFAQSILHSASRPRATKRSSGSAGWDSHPLNDRAFAQRTGI
jgi:hypothetical protein